MPPLPEIAPEMLLEVGVALLLSLGLYLVASVARRRVRRSPRRWAALLDLGLQYGAIASGVVLVAQALGLDLTALLATAGFATVALGFAAQKSLSNLIAGLFLLFDRPFAPGDTVELDGRLGEVVEITLMSTLVRTFDNLLVRLPNEKVLDATIVNLTRFPTRRVDVPIALPVGVDLPATEQLLRDALAALPEVLIEPAPEVWLVGLDEVAIRAELRAWSAKGQFLQTRAATVRAAHDALRRAGIDVAIPRMRLETRAPEPGPPSPD